MGIFKKDLFGSIEDEEKKINSLRAYLGHLEIEKERTLEWIKKTKGTENKRKLQEKLKKLCQEAEEVSKQVKNLEHKQEKQIEKKQKKNKKKGILISPYV